MNEWNKIFCIVSGEMNYSRSTEEVDILVHWNIFVIRRKYFCCVFGGRVGCTECGYVDVGVTEAGPSQLQLPLPCCRRCCCCTPHWSKLKKRIFGVWSMRHSLAPSHFNLRLIMTKLWHHMPYNAFKNTVRSIAIATDFRERQRF